VASVKIKLKVPATQHHRRKRPAPAHWRAISNVRYLFGLALYSQVWHYMEVSGKLQASAALSLRIYPSNRGVVVSHRRGGRCAECKYFLRMSGIKPRFLGHATFSLGIMLRHLCL